MKCEISIGWDEATEEDFAEILAQLRKALERIQTARDQAYPPKPITPSMASTVNTGRTWTAEWSVEPMTVTTHKFKVTKPETKTKPKAKKRRA